MVLVALATIHSVVSVVEIAWGRMEQRLACLLTHRMHFCLLSFLSFVTIPSLVYKKQKTAGTRLQQLQTKLTALTAAVETAELSLTRMLASATLFDDQTSATHARLVAADLTAREDAVRRATLARDECLAQICQCAWEE